MAYSGCIPGVSFSTLQQTVVDDDVLPYVQERRPDFTPTGAPVRLPGGNLNVVWRVPGAERSLIVKYAPPYIAADPDTPLDPSRLVIEARCLKTLASEEALSEISCSAVRAPRLLDVNEEMPVLLMEDVGDVPSLDQWLQTADAGAASEQGRGLGRFIGRLHASTYDELAYAEAFDNRPMQETRLAVQYRGVADMLRAAGVHDAEALGARAESLGKALLEPGCCLTMGDLWPPSVLVTGDGLRLIDWELAHYGRPLQDVAHWRAHLWMQRHRAPTAAIAHAVESLWAAFLTAYRDALGDAKAALWTSRETREAAVHVGAEILVRAVGPFQNGYVYAGLDPNHPAVQEAVSEATRMLRSPGVYRLRTDALSSRPPGNY
jgi:5-methylthioribose kinase